MRQLNKRQATGNLEPAGELSGRFLQLKSHNFFSAAAEIDFKGMPRRPPNDSKARGPVISAREILPDVK